MDEIIYLEQDEEIPSVIDKLKNIDSKSVALVVPKGAAVLQSVINLKILKREAEVLEKEIALVTQDKIGRNLASQVGLSVYDNVQSPRPIIQSPRPEPEINENIELDLSQKPDKKIPSNLNVNYYQEKVQSDSSKLFMFNREEQKEKNIEPVQSYTPTLSPFSANSFQTKRDVNIGGKKRSGLKLIYALIIVIIAIWGAVTFYPKSTISLVLQGESYQKDVSIIVDNNIDKNDAGRIAIPGELQEVESEVKQVYNATGSKDVGERATGSVKLANSTGDVQALESGAELKSASGLFFITTEAITIPKATASVDSQGKVAVNPGSAVVKVIAKESGDNYNTSPTDFTAVSNSHISGENTSAMSGGSSKKVAVISQSDLDNAKNDLQNQAQAKNVDELKNKAQGQIIYDNSITNDLVSFSNSKNLGDESDNFEATLKLKSRTLSLYDKNYREIIAIALNKDLQSSKELMFSNADEISIVSTKPDYSLGTMTLSGSVKTKIVSKIDNDKLKKDIKGKKISNAENIIKSINGVTIVQINNRPNWFKSIPTRLKNIIINKQTI
jgi:hypothetical protein